MGIKRIKKECPIYEFGNGFIDIREVAQGEYFYFEDIKKWKVTFRNADNVNLMAYTYKTKEDAIGRLKDVLDFKKRILGG